MKKTRAKPKALAELQKLLPQGELSFDPEVLAAHAADKWFASHRPDAVAFPASTESVSTLLRFADRQRLPVTARGAGHGYVGGCVPIQGGIVLSLARMNRIEEINPADFVAVVQAGVITSNASNPDAARKLEDFLKSDDGIGILKKFGFMMPGEN